jgi:hypothetical protein
VSADVIAPSCWRLVASYAIGVWGGLTAWAALAQYVLPGRGHALGKLGSFHWVFLINVLPALLCGLGFAVGLTMVRRSATAGSSRGRVTFALGCGFPLSLWMLGPVFQRLDAGMTPALTWCVLGSAGAAWMLARWERRRA